jgi:putative lipoprotein
MFNKKNDNRWAVLLSALTILAFLFITITDASSVNAGTDTMKTIEGSIWYRERMLLPTNAEVKVYLEDVARMDVAADVIATTLLKVENDPPWDFSLPYDSSRLHEKGRYGLRVRIEVEGKLMFINTSHIPAFDRDPGTPLNIMVSRVGGKLPAHTPDSSLTDTYWKLIELDGRSASLGAGKKELHMVLTNDGSNVRGFSGCNRFTGAYELNNDLLQFGPLAATMMACVEGMEQEQQFLEALGSTNRFTIKGESLTLYDAEDRLTLHFEAVYLK